jgi:hypothetical protein
MIFMKKRLNSKNQFLKILISLVLVICFFVELKTIFFDRKDICTSVAQTIMASDLKHGTIHANHHPIKEKESCLGGRCHLSHFAYQGIFVELFFQNIKWLPRIEAYLISYKEIFHWKRKKPPRYI